MSENSHVKEHCCVYMYALSDNTEIEFRQQCDHGHDERCEECEAIASTMKDIEELLSRALYPSDDDRDEALYLFHTAQCAIHTWKCHQLRSVQQDKARLDVIDLLDDETVLIVNDWAMKFLPQMYCESQTDWFGKRGLSWHISVVLSIAEFLVSWNLKDLSTLYSRAAKIASPSSPSCSMCFTPCRLKTPASVRPSSDKITPVVIIPQRRCLPVLQLKHQLELKW